jgi:hypothetical protein
MGGIVLPGLCEAESEPVTAIRYLKSRLRVLVSLHFVRLVGVRSVVAARESQIISRQIDQLRSGELIPASPQRADRGPHYSQATPARVRDPGSVLRVFTQERETSRSASTRKRRRCQASERNTLSGGLCLSTTSITEVKRFYRFRLTTGTRSSSSIPTTTHRHLKSNSIRHSALIGSVSW